MSRPTAFHDLPPQAYPITIRMWRQTDPWDAEPVFHVHIKDAGVVEVPGVGEPVRVEAKYGDGTCTRYPPEAWEGAPSTAEEQPLPDKAEQAMKGFTCPQCGRTSYNPNDLREGYCGNCHDWTGTPEE